MSVQARPHGTRARYNHGGCRCDECRAAAASYERQRQRRNAYGLSQWTDAAPVRAHVRSLMSTSPSANDGMSPVRIARLAGVDPGALQRLIYGAQGQQPSRRILRSTAERLLAVEQTDLADGALIDALWSWRRIEEMVGFGISRGEIARAIGQRGPKLQLSRQRLTARNARAIERLHWAVFKASTRFRRHCSCPVPARVASTLNEPQTAQASLRRAGLC